MSNHPGRRLIRWDPHETDSEDDVEFRLTYAGPLLASNTGQRDTRSARIAYKHRLRRYFHKQLVELWKTHPTLYSRWNSPPDVPGSAHEISGNWVENGFRFLPLVNRVQYLMCGIDVLMLRPGGAGYRFTTADIDNRLKTLLDVLRKPDSAAEIGTATPGDGEEPFCVLLQDDALVTKLAVETDSLLQPVQNYEWADVAVSAEEAATHGPDNYGEENMVRLVVSVHVRTYITSIDNIDFNGA